MLPAGERIRVEHSRTITSSGTVSVLIGIGAGVVHVFGAQCVATAGAGAYATLADDLRLQTQLPLWRGLARP